MTQSMDVKAHNKSAWDRQVEAGNPWTVPVSPAEVEAARQGELFLLLTPSKPVPPGWLPQPLTGVDVLCLASGGGQQGPLLAAAGAHVTVFDNSPAQLAQDRLVAEREGLALRTVEGDMADLRAFDDGSFDLIFHPVSNSFVAAVRPVWREAFRVLRPGGELLAGFSNPVRYLFAESAYEGESKFEVVQRLPYADADGLTEAELARYREEGRPLEFSHTLESQIGGQLEAGFFLTGFYEDGFPEEAGDALSA